MSTVVRCHHENELETTSWTCPREVRDGGDYCIFHRRTVEPIEDIRDRLLKELHDAEPHETDTSHPKYIGAELGRLSLDFVELAKDCPFPIDFRHTHIDVLSLKSSEVLRPITIQNATIDPPAEKDALYGQNTLFRSEFNADEALIKGDVDLTSTECRRGISFENAEIYGDLILDSAQIDGDLNLSGLEVDGDLHLENVTVEGNADLEDTIVNSDVYAHDLEIKGNFSCDGALLAPIGTPGQLIDFSQLSVSGNTTFNGTTFESGATFQNAALARPLEARRLSAKGDLEFQTAEIHSCRFVDVDTAKISVTQGHVADEFTITDSNIKRLDCTGANLRGDVRIKETAIEDQLLSKNTSFEDTVYLKKVKIDSKATFTEAEFNGRVRIHAGRYNVLDIERATFHDQLHLRDRVWLTELRASRTRFKGDVVFEDILCKKTVDVEAAVFNGTVELEEVRVATRAVGEGAYFEDRVTIADCQFGNGLSLRNTTFDARLEIISLTASGAGVVAVDLAHAEITSGYLASSTSGQFTYDFTHTSVGDVRVDTDTATFGDARIHQTTFDGFDFSSYRADLEAHEWSLHDDNFKREIPIADPKFTDKWLGWQVVLYVFAPIIVTIKTLAAGRRISKNENTKERDTEESTEDSATHQQSDPQIVDDESVTGPVTKGDVEEIQTTYLKAKNGATQVGATKVASEFFRREMHYRQVLHALNFFSGSSRLINFGRWAENGILRISAGYGERVKRVITSAILVIFGFAIYYSIVSPPEVQSPLDALAISTGSFVTLIFTETPQLSSEILQIAAMVEGFLGALFIALLVFTLTRSIHR